MVVVHRQSHYLWCCGQCPIIELNASIIEHCEHSKVGQDRQCFLGLTIGDGGLDPLRDPFRIRLKMWQIGQLSDGWAVPSAKVQIGVAFD